MTNQNFLKNFSYHSIEELIEEHDIQMRYSSKLEDLGLWGQYHPEDNLVLINPYLENREIEDLVVLHEWLHAYADCILEKDFTEKQIDWGAEWHLKQDLVGLSKVDYLRSFYHKEGF